LRASSSTIAETGWVPAMPPRGHGAGAIMCHVRRCRDGSKRPGRWCAFRRQRLRT
jgi:hypothetical protein